jgi:pyruvate dehydrogenase E1 component alpha subunit
VTLEPSIPPEPDLVQLLTPEGERIEHPDWPLTVSDDEVRSLYRDLVLVRRFDGEATALQRQGELGLWASCLGQEAAQVGAGRALKTHDMAFPTYREHGVAWCRDVDPLILLGMFRGTNLGGWDPLANNFNLYTIVIGAQTLHAAGYAMGVVRDDAVGTGDPERDTAVLAFFGDGASSQGDVNEAFVWAGAGNLPVVFFCQNNQWAISEPVERQSRVPLFQRASGFGFPGLRSTAMTCSPAWPSREARWTTPVRAGPVPHRGLHLPHGRAHDVRRPHPLPVMDETERWRLKDPLARVRSYLTRHTDTSVDFFDALEAESEQLAVRIREACRALPDPAPLSVFDTVYVDMPDELREQRDEFAAYLESFEAVAQ